ncbi:MAG: hypothetical protein AB4042_15215 [Leptolyngbyaceae cyanobacterium]
MRDHWIDGLIAVTTIGSLYWTLTQMAQQSTWVVGPPPDGTLLANDLPNSGPDDAPIAIDPMTAIAPPTSEIILGSDQPVDEDPDFDIDIDDLGAIATFENQRF